MQEMKRIKRTIVPFTLAGLLGVNGLILPADVSAAKKINNPGQFSDVASNHWANQYIVKMGLRNVVAGYEDGTFHPDESVTQSQALVMAIRNMGLTEEAEKYKTVAVPYNVPDWAKGSVALAIAKGLIKTSEKQFYPDMPASRAWVAQLMVRMIGKEEEVGKTANTTAFSDAANIPDWAKEYVKTAVSYGVISGYSEGGSYSFKPNRAVTRAEMVSLLGRGEKYLNIESSNTRLGVLQSVNGSVLTITNQSGTQYRYTITSKTKFYNGNQKTTSEALPPNSQLLVIGENGQAEYVEVVTSQGKVDNVKRTKATVEKVFDEAQTVVLRMEDGKLQTYSLARDASVYAGMDKVKLAQLIKGDQVEFVLDAEGKISELNRTNVSKEQSLEGSVYDIDKQNKLLTIKAVNGKLEAYQYTDSTYVEYKNKRFPSIEDLLPGDAVKLELQNGLVSKVIVANASTNAGELGTVKAISAQDKFITLQSENGQIQAYMVAPNAVISLSGTIAPTLADVKVGDKVEVKVENNMIVSLAVKNRTVQGNKDLLSGSIFAIDTTNRILSIKGSNGELRAYEIVPNAEILLTGNSRPSLTDLRKDMLVSIQLNEDNKVIYINADNRTRAEVVYVNPTDRLLTVKLETGETKVYVVDPNVDITIFDVSGEDLRDLRQNDKVALKLSGTKVLEIEVERTFVYRVTENGTTYSNRITAQNERGNARDLIVDGNVTLNIPGILYPKASDVKKGDVLRVTYLGNTLKSVAVVPSVYGQVVAVVPETNKIVVKDLNGVTSEIIAGYGTTIQIGDRQYTNLSALQVGNRVQIAEAAEGAKSILVLTKVEASFTSLDPLGDRIYTTKGSYYLPDSLFNRQVNLQSLLRSFKRDDNIAIYLLNNQVYEIDRN
jgi:Cu/Ag efflux protein CusF